MKAELARLKKEKSKKKNRSSKKKKEKKEKKGKANSSPKQELYIEEDLYDPETLHGEITIVEDESHFPQDMYTSRDVNMTQRSRQMPFSGRNDAFTSREFENYLNEKRSPRKATTSRPKKRRKKKSSGKKQPQFKRKIVV
jgi:hypothetical protein